MIKIIAWNIARRDEAWRYLLDTDADVALLSEASEPPPDVANRFEVDVAPWRTAGAGVNRPWRTAVVRISDRVGVRWLEPKPVDLAQPGELAVSRLGTLAVAIVTHATADPVVLASMYAPWERPHAVTESSWIYADGSVHRLISDVSALIGRQSSHRIVVAGDFNVLHGYGDHGSEYWASRYATVFERMTALGFYFAGPQAPHGRRADPCPEELPEGSDDVPTFYTNNQDPATATRQLDFVFASTGLEKNVRVRALNEIEQWGPSDHCRVAIEIL